MNKQLIIKKLKHIAEIVNNDKTTGYDKVLIGSDILDALKELTKD